MLSVIRINETEKWDEIVKSFKNYDVFYLSGYAKAFQLNGEGEPLLLYYNNGTTRAINVVMRRDISEAVFFKDQLPVNKWFDLSTPYGYGGFWVEGEDYELINEAYENYCREQGYVSEFVRFDLFSNYQPHYNGISETHTHNVVRSLDLSTDALMSDFEHKVRKNIKRAIASGLNIEIDTNGARLDDFLRIYYSTMNRANASDSYYFSREFFEALNELESNYIYAHILSEGQVISTELVLYGSENCYSFLGGTDSNYFHLRPNDFLKYEIIKWAKDKGFKTFVLGGGYGDDDGIFKYKKSFAPNGVVDFFIGKKIYNKEIYDKLVEDRRIEEFNACSNYFPLYRAKN